MTYRPLIKQSPEAALPKTEAYRKKRLNPPKGGRTDSYYRALFCRADEMYDELTTRLQVQQATIADLADELNKRAAPTDSDSAPSAKPLSWLDPPTRDPGGTP